jgi:hypothetical protein
MLRPGHSTGRPTEPQSGAHAGHGVSYIATERGPNRGRFSLSPGEAGEYGNLAKLTVG